MSKKRKSRGTLRSSKKLPKTRSESSPGAQASEGGGSPPRRALIGGIVLGLAILAGSFAFLWRPDAPSVERQLEVLGPLTYADHVAPIIYESCTPCHRPGQAAPFSLLRYEDVVKHRRVIRTLTAERRMPPWLPAPGVVAFDHDRSLTELELATLQSWLESGAPEGDPEQTPEPPRFSNGWALGEPDLVVTMPEAYTLPAEGPDVYRNFVVPIERETLAYVTAFDFNPGAWQAVHHAFILFDTTNESREADRLDLDVGFAGMAESAIGLDGHFLTWQPGAHPTPVDPELAWELPPKVDLIIQAHLRPTGKPEPVQASVAFYFSPSAPKRKGFKVLLTSRSIDIPAGDDAYSVHDTYTLPVDVEIREVLPHAHYLARAMRGWATLPSGKELPLIEIGQWDFSWQGHYKYKKPIDVPSGTELSMHWVFDNSDDNPDNPFFPARRVFFGPQSSDEMAELWLQVVPKNPEELVVLEADFQKRMHGIFMEGAQQRLVANPQDARAHTDLGFALFEQGQLEEARGHWVAAARADTTYDEPHYYLGVLFRRQNQLPLARDAFAEATRLNDSNAKAHGNLGIVEAQLGNAAPAVAHLRRALELNPEDAIARRTLAQIQERLRERGLPVP